MREFRHASEVDAVGERLRIGNHGGLGLRHWTVVLDDPEEVEAVRERVRAAGSRWRRAKATASSSEILGASPQSSLATRGEVAWRNSKVAACTGEAHWQSSKS
jgi:hypothetical protein